MLTKICIILEILPVDLVCDGISIIFVRNLKLRLILHDTMKATDVFDNMNRLGSLGEDFLFGIDFEKDDGFLIRHPLSQSEILFHVNGTTNCHRNFCAARSGSISIISSSRTDYEAGFDKVRHGLERGDTFLLNLTARTEIRTDFSLEEIFMRSKAPYKLYIPGKFVCFSPECFIRIRDNEISTFPMKGTADASVKDAEKALMENEKEFCEHYTIVDLMRNDLNSVAENVSVRRFRYIDRIQTLKGEILQTSSEIAASMKPGWQGNIGTIMDRLLPAGSISGAPKQSTTRLIREAEKCKRGYYTGVFGYFDGSSLDSAVLIRFIEQDGEKMFFRSGGGITINSRCEDEYNEVLEKVYLPFRH